MFKTIKQKQLQIIRKSMYQNIRNHDEQLQKSEVNININNTLNIDSHKTTNLTIIILALLIIYKISHRWSQNIGNIPQNIQIPQIMEQLIQFLHYCPYDEQMLIRQKYNHQQNPFLGSSKYFAYRMLLAKDKMITQQIEDYYYEDKYQINKNNIEKQICVLVFRSQQNDQKQLINDLLELDYQNFSIVISDEKGFKGQEYRVNKTKIQIVKTQTDYYIQNIRKCQKNSIIIDIPKTGKLIGKKLLSLTNHLYQNQSIKFAYTNTLLRQQKTNRLSSSISPQNPKYSPLNMNLIVIFDSQIFHKYQQNQNIEIPNQYPHNQQRIKLYSTFLQIVNQEQIHYVDEYFYYVVQQKISKQLSAQFFKQNDKALVGFTKQKYQEQNSIFHIKDISKPLKDYLVNVVMKTLSIIHPKLKGVLFNNRIKNTRAYIERVHISFNLYKYPEYLPFMEAEPYYYQFKLGKYRQLEQQNRFCVVADGLINLEGTSNNFVAFLKSISFLHYQNFHLVLTLNKPTQQYRVKQINRFLQMTFPHLIEKMTIIFTTKTPIPSLQIKDNMIKNYCKKDEIVVPLQIDSKFIGSQFFKIVNSVFHNTMLIQNFKPLMIQLSHILIIDTKNQMFRYDSLNASNIVQEKQFNLSKHFIQKNQQNYWNSFYPFVFNYNIYQQIDWSRQQKQSNIEFLKASKIADGLIYRQLLNITQNKRVFYDQIFYAVTAESQIVEDPVDLGIIKYLDEKHTFFKKETSQS